MKSGRLKLGIVGCGAIGSYIARYCEENLSSGIEISAFFDIDGDKAQVLKKISKDASIARSIDDLIEMSDLVVEAASVKAAPEVLEKAIGRKREVMIMSVGGLVDREDLLSSAREKGCRVYIPSGAVFGLDGIKAATLKKVDRAVLTTRKPVKGLRGAPYIEDKGIDLDSIRTERLIFEGSVLEAIRAFPKNINVSCALSLAGIGVKNLKVRIICSPEYNRNTHEIELNGESGRLYIKAENVPLPDNPKTSFLAALSAVAALKGIIDKVRIGT